MAYKLNGNVIIDDNAKLSSNNLPIIKKPINLEPTGGNTVYGVTFLISDYDGLYEAGVVKFSQFQVANVISFNAANIVYDSGNISGGANSVVANSFTVSETYYWRARYLNTDDVSEYSDTSCFVFGGVTPPPDGLGCPYLGGYFAGNIDIGGGVCYHLIIASNTEGYCSSRQWKTSCTFTPSSSSLCNGYDNTYPALDNATHPAGYYASTLVISGYSDWYLPARDEMIATTTNRACMPAGETYCQTGYWTSTQRIAGNAADQGDFAYYGSVGNFSVGFPNNGFKIYNKAVRAHRRVPIV